MPELHKHLVVDAVVKNPPTDPEAMKDWLRRLVKAVDMEIFIDPVAKYCNDPLNSGLTGSVVITTSHSSIHVWDNVEHPYLKFDLYSCKDFNFQDVLPLLKEFEPTNILFEIKDRPIIVDGQFQDYTVQEKGFLSFD